MELERYELLTTENSFDYHFFSEGPNGKIKKVVQYSGFTTAHGSFFYNLAFGDWNEEKQQINDTHVSNNKDRDKILATVAFTALYFTDRYHTARIFAQGVNPVRTRLYQMGIGAHWKEINILFIVYGFVETEGWQLFKKRINYRAFLIIRR